MVKQAFPAEDFDRGLVRLRKYLVELVAAQDGMSVAEYDQRRHKAMQALVELCEERLKSLGHTPD